MKAQEQKTPLYPTHVAQGAKMVDFAGWLMPLQYGKVLEEHQAVRHAAGLFDVSHMGLLSVRSGDLERTRAFLDGLVPQDLTRLTPGKAVYTQFLNPGGGILDDVIVYQLPNDLPLPGFEEFLVICNAGNRSVVLEWLQGHAGEGIEIQLLSHNYGLLALQGPRFATVLEAGGVVDLPKRFHLQAATLFGRSVLLSRTGYTGEDGVEILVSYQDIEALWRELLTAGEPLGLRPIGLAARDTLRLEAAYPLHGHDIIETTTPLEAGLGWSVKLDKGADFIGKSVLQAQAANGPGKTFHCFQLLKKTIPRQHDVILHQGQPIGEVTSGSISPTLNQPIGMGYCSVPLPPGTRVQIQIRGVAVDAEIVARPFYKAAQ